MRREVVVVVMMVRMREGMLVHMRRMRVCVRGVRVDVGMWCRRLRRLLSTGGHGGGGCRRELTGDGGELRQSHARRTVVCSVCCTVVRSVDGRSGLGRRLASLGHGFDR